MLRVISILLIHAFFLSSVSFAVDASDSPVQSRHLTLVASRDDFALAPPLATRPPCEIRYDEKTDKFDVVTNNNIIEASDRETVQGVQRSEALGKSFRNRWAFVDVSYLIGQMLILTQEHKLHNPKDILIPLVKKHISNRNGEAEILLEGFNIDGIEAVREGQTITGFSLPITRNGIPAYRLVYNLQSGETNIPMKDGKTIYVRVESVASRQEIETIERASRLPLSDPAPNTPAMGDDYRRGLIEGIITEHPELKYDPEELYYYIRENRSEIFDIRYYDWDEYISDFHHIVTVYHFTGVDNAQLIFRHGYYGQIYDDGGYLEYNINNMTSRQWIDAIRDKGKEPVVIAFRIPESWLDTAADFSFFFQYQSLTPCTRVKAIPQGLRNELEKLKLSRGVSEGDLLSELEKYLSYNNLGYIGPQHIDTEETIRANQIVFGNDYDISKLPFTANRTPPTVHQQLAEVYKSGIAANNLSPESERIHAANFQDTLAYIQAQPQTQPLILALGTSWIKGYEKGRYLQYDALNPLIGSLRTYCESKGIPLIIDEDYKLLARINAEIAKDGISEAKVVVLAGKDTVTSDEFTTLRNDRKNAFLVGVDSQELTTDSYIRLMEMLTLALKLSAGIEVSLDSTFIKFMKDDKLHIYIFIPPAQPMNYEQLKQIYKVQKFA